MARLHCRIGSLESINADVELPEELHCRIGSLENLEYSLQAPA